MKGYLAFDRDGIDTLRRALTRSVAEREDWFLDDPVVAEARTAIDRAIDRLAPWESRLRAIALSGALMDGFTWRAPFGPDGFIVIGDRAPAMTAADVALVASVLAQRIARLDLDSLSTVDLVTELAAVLGPDGVADDPAATAALLAAIGSDRLAGVLAELSLRLRSTPNTLRLATPWVHDALDVVRRLGRGLGGELGRAPGPGGAGAGSEPWGRLLIGADPLFAAALLDGAADRLAPEAAADLGARLLDRLHDAADEDPYWRDAARTVVETMAADPERARRTLLALAGDAVDFTLFEIDPVAAGTLVAQATTPAAHDATAVREPLLRLIAALAEREACAGTPVFSLPAGSPSDPFDPSRWWCDEPTGVFWPVPWTVVPNGIGAVIAPWLPYLVEPIQLAGWTPAPGAPVPWTLDEPDALTAALTLTIQHEADALAVRLAASTFLATSIGAPSSPSGARSTQQHAAYLLGGVEDAARAAGYATIADRETSISGGLTLFGFALNAAPTWFSAPAGTLAGLLGDRLVPDLRDAVAAGETAGVGVATAAGYSAVVAWRAIHAPGAPLLPPFPAGIEADDREDRADQQAGPVADLVASWAETSLDDAQATEALELYDRVRSAAFDGTALVA